MKVFQFLTGFIYSCAYMYIYDCTLYKHIFFIYVHILHLRMGEPQRNVENVVCYRNGQLMNPLLSRACAKTENWK